MMTNKTQITKGWKTATAPTDKFIFNRIVCWLVEKMTEGNEAVKKKLPMLKAMSPTEYEELTNNFKKNVKGGCLFCGSTEFNIPKEIFLIQAAQEDGWSIPPPSMPVFLLQCTNCGFTYMFSPPFLKSVRDTE